MCKVCKTRGDLLLYPHEEEREKKGVEKVPAESARILPEDLRGRSGILLRLKERWYENIVLNIPHAGVKGLGSIKCDNKVNLLAEVRKWTDWYTDLIFIPEKNDSIKHIIADYSRFAVDVERLLDDPLEKKMPTLSSILAWKIPWMEKPGRLQSMGSQRVMGHILGVKLA